MSLTTVKVPPRCRAAAKARPATHTPDGVVARPCGELPTKTFLVTFPDRRSMWSSVASNSSLTQSASLVATMAPGPSPTPTMSVTVCVAGLIFVTV